MKEKHDIMSFQRHLGLHLRILCLLNLYSRCSRSSTILLDPGQWLIFIATSLEISSACSGRHGSWIVFLLSFFYDTWKAVPRGSFLEGVAVCCSWLPLTFICMTRSTTERERHQMTIPVLMKSPLLAVLKRIVFVTVLMFFPLKRRWIFDFIELRINSRKTLGLH